MYQIIYKVIINRGLANDLILTSSHLVKPNIYKWYLKKIVGIGNLINESASHGPESHQTS